MVLLMCHLARGWRQFKRTLVTEDHRRPTLYLRCIGVSSLHCAPRETPRQRLEIAGEPALLPAAREASGKERSEWECQPQREPGCLVEATR